MPSASPAGLPSPPLVSFTEFPAVTTAEWQARLARELKGRDPATLRWPLPDGFALEPFYHREAWDALGGPPAPLPAPATPWRNVPALVVPTTAPDGRLQVLHAADALQRGADGLHFELSGDPAAFDVSYLAEMLPLATTFVGYTVAAAPDEFLARLAALVPGAALRGFLRFAPHSLAEGTAVELFRAPLQRCVVLARHWPDFRALAINGAYYGNHGGTPTQQLAISLSVAAALLAELPDEATGLPLADVAAALHLHLAVGTSYFPELAKFRAARRLWAMLRHAFGLPGDDDGGLYLHASTSSWNCTTLDPHTNLLRHTTEAMSAVLGGANAISVAAYDCVFQEPTEFSRRLARNLPLILKEEAQLARVNDPAAGSYFLETLTDDLARRAWALFQELEAAGGMPAVRPRVAEMLRSATTATFQRIATGEQVVVGTNRFQNAKEVFAYNPKALLRSAHFDTTRATYPSEVLRLATALHFERRAKQAKNAALVLLGTGTIEHIENEFLRSLPTAEQPALRRSHPEGTLSLLFSSPEGALLMYATPEQFLQVARTLLRVAVADSAFMPPALITSDLATLQEAARVFGLKEFTVEGYNTEDVLTYLQGR